MTEARPRSEMKAAQELPISERPTLSSVPSAIPVVPDDEQPSTKDRLPKLKPHHEPSFALLEERLERLLEENRVLMTERKQEREIGQHRIERANQCLQHARDARTLIKAYVDACTEAEKLAAASPFETLQADVLKLEIARAKANDAYAALVAFIAKPL